MNRGWGFDALTSNDVVPPTPTPVTPNTVTTTTTTGGGGVREVGNHIYFSDDITQASVLNAAEKIRTVGNRLRLQALDDGIDCPPITLHISSYGGSLLAGFSFMDTVRLSPVPIHIVVEGLCASAATLPLVVAKKRIMPANAHILIHQLSAVAWGKYTELQDAMKNFDKFMKHINSIYTVFTKIEKEKLEEILKHDLWFNAVEAAELGIVDIII